MRAFVYLRQSLDRDGVGAAVARQREDCLKLCAERGWEVARVFTDNDVSASSRKPRPAYSQMLEGVVAGQANIVVSWHVDRLTRKLTDLEHLIELSHDLDLKVVTVNGDLDLSNDSGRLVGRILASVARGEVERKGARQRRAAQQAAAEGRPAGGRRAFGYTSGGHDTVPQEAALVTAAYTDLLAGASLKSIARAWNDAGVTTTMGNAWRHDTVRGVLNNPRNAGQRRYRGQVVGTATWPPLVDVDTFNAAAALLAMPERRTTATTARKYLLPSIARCWKCGSDVATGHTRHGKRVYVCRANKCISRAADPVDELVERIVVARLSRSDAADLLTASSDRGPELEHDKQQAAAIRQRIDDLAVGLEEGLLTLAAVRASSARLQRELNDVEVRIRDAVHVDVLSPIVDAADVAEAWAQRDLAQKRAAIDALMTITLLKPKGGRTQFDPTTVQIEWKAGR